MRHHNMQAVDDREKWTEYAVAVLDVRTLYLTVIAVVPPRYGRMRVSLPALVLLVASTPPHYLVVLSWCALHSFFYYQVSL